MILWLFGCAGVACGRSDTDALAASPDHGLVVATSDFSVGALATVDVAVSSIQDAIVATSGDTVVATDAGLVFQIDRSPPEAVRAWDPADWSAPVAEYAIPGGSNPQDAAICGGQLFVTLLAEPRVAVFALDGSATGSVDLAALATDDGNPEAATLARAGERLFVGLQQLDTRGAVWLPSGPGTVAEIDCETLAVIATWQVGPNPSLHALSGEAILVRTGTYGDPDGELAILPIDGDLGEALLTEVDLGDDLGDVAVVDDVAIVITAALDFSQHTARCVNLATGVRVDGEARPNFLSGVAAGGDGRAWIAQSVDYADATSPTGLLALDPVTCTSPPDGLLPTLLPPYALAAY